MILSKATIT